MGCQVNATNSVTREEALHLINTYANQHKRTYVRVGERFSYFVRPILGLDGFELVLHTKVYSKTWSKTAARIRSNPLRKCPCLLTTATARRLLAGLPTNGKGV